LAPAVTSVTWMSLCEAWKASMICCVTACELPGLLDQKVISLAGVTFDQSTSLVAAAPPPPPPPPDVLGPPQAASAATVPTAPARPRNRRRSSAALVSADGM
jgi:hypothetical protein